MLPLIMGLSHSQRLRQKKNWKQAVLDDEAFSMLHLEHSEWNVDDFWLLPVSLQEAGLQDQRH